MRPLRDGPAAQADPGALLTLVQWLSPAFPTGGFAYSGGMETAIARRRITDSASAARWIGDVIDCGSPFADAVLLCHALAPGADHAHLAAHARALAATGERLRETDEQGAALTRTINALQGTEHPPLPLPVALGRAAAPLGLPPAQVAAHYLHAVAQNLASQAVRIVPLGQTDGQRIVADLRPLILSRAEAAAATPLHRLATAAFASDIASAQHETLDVRLFRT